MVNLIEVLAKIRVHIRNDRGWTLKIKQKLVGGKDTNNKEVKKEIKKVKREVENSRKVSKKKKDKIFNL